MRTAATGIELDRTMRLRAAFANASCRADHYSFRFQDNTPLELPVDKQRQMLNGVQIWAHPRPSPGFLLKVAEARKHVGKRPDSPPVPDFVSVLLGGKGFSNFLPLMGRGILLCNGKMGRGNFQALILQHLVACCQKRKPKDCR